MIRATLGQFLVSIIFRYKYVVKNLLDKCARWIFVLVLLGTTTSNLLLLSIDARGVGLSLVLIS